MLRGVTDRKLEYLYSIIFYLFCLSLANSTGMQQGWQKGHGGLNHLLVVEERLGFLLHLEVRKWTI